MIIALDVDYRDDLAVVGAVAFDDWLAATPATTWTTVHRGVAEYRSGHFYERELPPLIQALTRSSGVIAHSAVVVDGYVWLGDRPGLGKHLFDAIGVPVVGVAKRTHADAHTAIPVLRGTSTRPLWVTAEGILPHTAAALVKAMHGEHRQPTLLKLADTLARTTAL